MSIATMASNWIVTNSKLETIANIDEMRIVMSRRVMTLSLVKEKVKRKVIVVMMIAREITIVK